MKLNTRFISDIIQIEFDLLWFLCFFLFLSISPLFIPFHFFSSILPCNKKNKKLPHVSLSITVKHVLFLPFVFFSFPFPFLLIFYFYFFFLNFIGQYFHDFEFIFIICFNFPYSLGQSNMSASQYYIKKRCELDLF